MTPGSDGGAEQLAAGAAYMRTATREVGDLPESVSGRLPLPSAISFD